MPTCVYLYSSVPFHYIQILQFQVFSDVYFLINSFAHGLILCSLRIPEWYFLVSLYLFTISTVTVSIFRHQVYFTFLFLTSLIFFYEFSQQRGGSWFVKSRTEILIEFKAEKVFGNIVTYIVIKFHGRDLKVEKRLLCRCLIISLFHYFCNWKLDFIG